MRRTVQLLATGLAAGIVAMAATACTASSTGSPSVPSSAAAAYPATVGGLTLRQRPDRIVSLSPTATEMLYAIGAGEQVVAVDDNSTYPTTAPKTALSGYQPNAEAIATYRPDLVVVSNDTGNIIDQLRTLKIPAFLSPAAPTIDDVYQEIRDLGTLTGHGAQARMYADKLRQDVDTLLASVPHRTTPLTYYFELDQTLYSVTSKTFIGSLLAKAGLVNIADASSASTDTYLQLSAEVVVKANPDLILLADTKCCAQSAATVAKRPGWASLKAIQGGHVVALDDDIASRWGPRVVDLLRLVTAAVVSIPAT
jgi:cobalamin transport system substrate-binding protein